MKTKILLVSLVMCFASAVCLAENVNVGTWKLNEGKSKFSVGAPKSDKVVVVAAGDNLTVTIDGTLNGKPVRSEWTGKFDGKEYPVTGDPYQEVRSYTKVDDHNAKFEIKRGGKVVLSGTLAISADGKTRTVNAGGTSADGKKIDYTAVYDKQ